MTKTIFHLMITTNSTLQVEFFVKNDKIWMEWTVCESS